MTSLIKRLIGGDKSPDTDSNLEKLCGSLDGPEDLERMEPNRGVEVFRWSQPATDRQPGEPLMFFDHPTMIAYANRNSPRHKSVASAVESSQARIVLSREACDEVVARLREMPMGENSDGPAPLFRRAIRAGEIILADDDLLQLLTAAETLVGLIERQSARSGATVTVMTRMGTIAGSTPPDQKPVIPKPPAAECVEGAPERPTPPTYASPGVTVRPLSNQPFDGAHPASERLSDIYRHSGDGILTPVAPATE